MAVEPRLYRLSDALDCAERELKRRQNVYPVMVKQGRLSQARATWELEHQQYIIDIIKGRIHAHEWGTDK